MEIKLLFSGIVLPAVALIVELVTHICAEVFFDPLPTIWHAAIFGFVPVSNLAVWRAVIKNKSNHLKFLGIANGIAVGVTFFYTLIFLPLLPVSFVAIIFFGIGLLSLAPLFAFISALICRKQLKKIAVFAGCRKPAGLWEGIAIAALFLVIVEIPSTVTRIGIKMATADSTSTQTSGIRLLRMLGDEEVMLKMCYERSRMATDLIGFLFALSQDPVRPSDVRKIFYQVTGSPFNSKPAPVFFRNWRDNDFDFDSGLGGTTVAGRVNRLFLSASRMDGSLDPDAGLGYLEWTLVFENRSQIQREARAQILLPPGGAVSRLTLWIDGEPREAAFAARKKVREAYSSVVRQRRDPVLVTTCGRDRVLVQCFPVPPGGEMKIRLGITTPLILETRKEGILLPPRFLERNFSIPKHARHSIWIESRFQLTSKSPGLSPEHPEKGLCAIRGLISDTDLSAAGGTSIRATRDPDVIYAWTPDPLSKGSLAICQEVERVKPAHPKRVIFVIDGSRGMARFISAVSDAVFSMSEGVEFRIIVASDEVEELSRSFQQGSLKTIQEAGKQLKKYNFKGGCDNVPALLRALEYASRRPGGIVVWIHDQQPILLQTTELFRQQRERRPNTTRIIDFQVANGPNRIIEKLADLDIFVSLPIIDNIEKDLKKLFMSWEEDTTIISLKRNRVNTNWVFDIRQKMGNEHQ